MISSPSDFENSIDDEAKKGCWLGCAVLSTLLVMAAGAFLVYVAAHRASWKQGLARQARYHIESSLREVLPEGTSEILIDRLGDTLEQGFLTWRPQEHDLKKLQDSLDPIGGGNHPPAGKVFEALLRVTETVFAGRFDPEKMESLRRWSETVDYETLDSRTAERFLTDLNDTIVRKK